MSNKSIFTLTKEEQQGSHDDVADVYDTSVMSEYDKGDVIREKYFELLDTVISYLDYSDGIKILDIGIGTGLLVEKLPPYIPVYGIDISEKMMKKLKEKKLNVKLRLGSFLKIPFENQFFDRIISTIAFHHVSYGNKNRAFDEMDRVLKPGGRILIGDLMIENDDDKEKLRLNCAESGKTGVVEVLDYEYPANIQDSIKYLDSIGYKTEYERVSLLSWILQAEKSI
ncbi:MAG: class I SAM-dependent methyltransferase [Ignavibacteria bacterium]